jgi:ABC-type Mn2+/Zn2+ transport system permease subunit
MAVGKRSSRGLVFICAFSLLFILLSLTVRVASAAPASAPADSVGQNTEDILKELDAVPSTQPSGAATPLTHTEPQSLIRLFRNVLMTAAALGIASSILGMFVLLRREALVAFAIPQVVAVGAAIGMRMGWPTLPPALGVAIIALIYFALSKRWAASNWIVPSAYIAGLSLSFLIIANHGQDVDELQRMFVGVDVAVGDAQAMFCVPILLVVGGVCAVLWRRWLLLAQAPAAAELAGLKLARWDTVFLALLTIVMLLGTDTLGVVMVLAMLFLPAATVLPWARRLPAAMLSAAVLSLVFLVIGFYLSNHMNWPLSQSIGGTGFAALVLSHIAAQFK